MEQKLDLRKRIGLELFRKIQKNSVKLHELKTLFWECTLRCNLSCRHCGSDCKKIAGTPDMPIADFLKIIDEITPHVNPNKTLIIIAGGEALVRKDIEVCGSYLYDHGFPWGIVTNGMLLDRKRLDSLLAAGMRSLAISLDGFEEVHNNIRRNEDSYKKAIAAIKMLVNEKDLVWDIVTCATPLNINSLKTFKEFLISLGVKRWRIFTVFPVGRAAEDKELQITDNEFKQLMEFIKAT
ncbi:MAG: radical SAM protein, partial [Rikenellaceae bacterium]